ncbi:MAG: PorP/SprF family type IX secretion system membrane protein, partial [Bacteroidales bacterium]
KLGVNNGSQKVIPSREENDRAFTESGQTFFVLNAGFGALYYADQYWAGFSVPRFFGYKSEASGKYKMSHEVSDYEYHFAGGGEIALPSEFAIEPSALIVLSAVNPFVVAVNAMGVYKNTYKAGLGYRYGEAFIILIGYNLNRQFSLGYSYDINIGERSGYTSGSHEINIQYKFGYKVNASNPREF